MRTKFASVAVGFGMFLIVAAVLVKAYAYPSLAKVPAEYESVTDLQALGAEVFNSDPSVLAAETVDLSIASRTIADTGAEAPDDVVVWVNNTTISRADGSVFQQSRDRSAFDVVSGENVDCASCETWVEVAAGERVDVTRTGQMYKLPFDTQKQDYQFWDGTIGESTTMSFEGEEDIQGLTVYKFVQRIDERVVETREVPGSVFGSDEPSVDAEMWYGMTRTLWIEPATGSPVDRSEERTQELRYDGVSVPAFNGTVEYTDAQVDELVADAKTNATMLSGMQLLYPLLMGLLGAALVALGLFLGRSSGHRAADRRADDPSLVGV